MQKYREILESRGTGSPGAGPVTECDNWEDLATLAEQAEEEYKNQGGRVRKLSRKVGDYQSALHGLAGLLPTDSNFSIMSGGVKLLLHVSCKGQ